MSLKNEAQTALQTTKTFYKEYVSGMNRERFNKEFRTDTERIKSLYQETVEVIEREQGRRLPGPARFLKFMTSLTQRLNPTRRLTFGLGSLAVVSHYLLSFFGLSGFVFFSELLLPFGFGAMFMLLMVELLEKSDVIKEIDLARNIQLSLLPETSVNKENLEVHSFAHTAKEVGGDYVDVIKTEKGTYVVIADVSGKGLTAALYMVRMQALVNLIINRDNPTPKELFIELNEHIKSDPKDKTFVTACAAFFPDDEDNFLFARAGHNAPIYFSKERDATFELKPDGFALGMTKSKNLGNYMEEKKYHFRPGDSVLFYTDGLNEARNEVGQEFGEERLEALMEIYGSLHAKSVIHKVQSSLENFIGKEQPLDDITFTCVHRPG